MEWGTEMMVEKRGVANVAISEQVSPNHNKVDDNKKIKILLAYPIQGIIYKNRLIYL